MFADAYKGDISRAVPERSRVPEVRLHAGVCFIVMRVQRNGQCRRNKDPCNLFQKSLFKLIFSPLTKQG